MRLKPTILLILAASVAAIVVFYLVSQEDYGDPARRAIERAVAAKP